MTDDRPLSFGFLDVPLRKGKPRTNGLTIVRDRMRGLGEQREFLQTYAQFVDQVKISNMAPRLYPEAFLIEKLDLYRAFDVHPFIGGIMFENAYAQGKEDAFFDYFQRLGNPGIEISDNIIDISERELLTNVTRAKKAGLSVVVEWGEKYPSTIFDPAKAAIDMEKCLSAGASHIIFERAELDQIFAAEDIDSALALLSDLCNRVGNDNLIFEVETQPQMVGVLRQLGRDVNLGPNIDFELVKWLEPSRLGISREMGHTTIETAIGADGVRSRLF